MRNGTDVATFVRQVSGGSGKTDLLRWGLRYTISVRGRALEVAWVPGIVTLDCYSREDARMFENAIENNRKPAWMTMMVSALLAALVALSGCNHFFGHDDQVKDPMTVRDQGLSCVRTVGADLELFMNGGDRDPVLIVDCLSGALTKFSENTRGASRDGWTRGELSSFFETYFKEESETHLRVQTSASRKQGAGDDASTIAAFDEDWVAQARRRAVVSELFRWKASLFGGGDTTLSRDELARIRTLLIQARVPLAQWRGAGKTLSFRESFHDHSADIAKIERLTKSIRELSSLLAAELSTTPASAGTPGSTRHREPMNLLTLSSSLEQAGLRVLDTPERKALISAIKRVILAGEPQQISGDEWPELVRQAGELWIGALRIQYGIVQNTSAYDRDLDFVQLTSRDLAASIARMVDRHDGRISNENLAKLISQMEANGLLPNAVRAKSVNATLEAIFGKLLSGNSRSGKRELSMGLQRVHLERLNDVIQDWAEGQRVVLEIIAKSDYATIDHAKLVMSQIATKGKDRVDEAARLQLSELLLRGRPLVRDAMKRPIILPNEKILGYNRTDLENLNIARVLMSAAMQGYSYEIARAGVLPQINEAEIQELFMDLKSIGRDLGIVDVRSLQSGIRTFMEANIFLSVSDGNAAISLHEMVEWFETVMGAGRVADAIHEDLVQEGAGGPRCGTGPIDVFGKMRLNAQCFRDHVLPVFRRRMAHLPNFLRALDEAEKTRQLPQFLRTLERASRALGDSDLPIESSDVRVMSPIIHYVEALFARFDLNSTSHLETPEVWSAFPLIRPFIQKLAVDSSGKPIKLSAGEEKAVYSWLLEVGTPPTSTLYGKIALKSHQWTMWTVKEHAGFRDVVNILANFQEVGRAKKNNDVLRFYSANAKAWEEGLTRGDKPMMDKTRDLFQCASEADVDLARLIQARRTDIFAVSLKTSEDDQALAFLNRFKSMIQADPQLQVTCMAF